MFEIKSVNFIEIYFFLHSYVTNPDNLLCLLSRLRVERSRNLFRLEAGTGVVSAPERQTSSEAHLVSTRGCFSFTATIGMTTCLHLVPTFRILATRSALLSASLWCGA